MSYTAIKAELVQVLAAVPGIVTSLGYEPTSAHAPPVIYSHLDGFERDYESGGDVLPVKWRTLHRLLIRWQDSQAAELEVDALVDRIPAAVEAAQHLYGLLRGGRVWVTMGDAGWTDVGGTEYRSVDFWSEAVEYAEFPEV